jgi:isoprenylcysteine carboxyl methyltransferase (ICMT) family protein YpbQ
MDSPDISNSLAAIIVLAIVIFFYLPLWNIIRKAGYNGWWILIVFVPLVNVIMWWLFAFADWPNLARRST